MLRPADAVGFTTIELMVVAVLVGVLAAVASPGFQAQVRKARRTDAMAAMAQVQQAQERWRSRQPRFADSMTELGLATTSPGGHYSLASAADEQSPATAYSVSATALGAQAQDSPCRHLRLLAKGGQITQQSGPDTTYGNDVSSNRACWPQ